MEPWPHIHWKGSLILNFCVFIKVTGKLKFIYERDRYRKKYNTLSHLTQKNVRDFEFSWDCLIW
jgi:hypothetical protein